MIRFDRNQMLFPISLGKARLTEQKLVKAVLLDCDFTIRYSDFDLS